MERLKRAFEKYKPVNEQEFRDRDTMLAFLKEGASPFLRDNKLCHFTGSGWIVNQDRTKVLMVYHNLYQSWSWTGGHADGETDLLAVALREAREETGIEHIRPVSEEIFSLETIVVNGHEKRGQYVPSHLHMNVTYLLEAQEADVLRIKPDENSGVQWIPVEKLSEMVSEPWMMERVYEKLIAKMKA